MHDFINQDNKEGDLCSIGTFIPSNVIVDIKAVPIPLCPWRIGVFGILPRRQVYS